MKDQQIIEEAKKLLEEIKEVPLNRLTVGEALFLFRNCLRKGGKGFNVLETFDKEDLLELMEIVLAVTQRGGPTAIH